MSCQIEPVERAPRLDALGQVGRVEGDDQRRDLVLVRQQVEAADDVARPLGDDADDELGRVVDREAALVVATRGRRRRG